MSAYIPSTPSQSLNYSMLRPSVTNNHIHPTPSQPTQHLKHTPPATLTQYTDTLSVLDDVIAVLQSSTTDDIQLIQKIQQLTSELAAMKSTNELQYKQLITQLTSDLTHLTSAHTTAHHHSSDLTAKHAELSQQKQQVEQQVNMLTASVQQLEQQNTDLQHTLQTVETVQRQTQGELATAVPITVNTISLYQKFSNITWDYSKPVEQQVKGTFHFTDPLGLQAFDIKVQQPCDDDSRYQVCEQLWQIMYKHHSKLIKSM